MTTACINKLVHRYNTFKNASLRTRDNLPTHDFSKMLKSNKSVIMIIFSVWYEDGVVRILKTLFFIMKAMLMGIIIVFIVSKFIYFITL